MREVFDPKPGMVIKYIDTDWYDPYDDLSGVYEVTGIWEPYPGNQMVYVDLIRCIGHYHDGTDSILNWHMQVEQGLITDITEEWKAREADGE